MAHCRADVTGNTVTIKRLPDYGDYWQLADRSLGHTIAGLGVLYAGGRTALLPVLRDFFRHYLIARQLNDDAHDWEADLRQGRINSVAVLIIKDWSVSQRLPKRLSFARHLPLLRQTMWDQTIDEVCRLIDDNCQAARQAISSSGQFDSEVLDKMLRPLERAAQEALAKRDETQLFIKTLDR